MIEDGKNNKESSQEADGADTGDNGDMLSDTENNEGNQPQLKRFKQLDRVSNLLQKQEKEVVIEHEMSVEEKQLEHYCEYKPSCEEMSIDSLDFWAKNFNTYPLLSPIA